MSIAIKTTNLSRTYQSYLKPEGIWNSVKGMWNRKYTYKYALKGANLEIEKGKIIGLVGANGAGKTTLLKILSGLISPTEGEARVLGYNPWNRESAYLKKISILLGQKNQLWWDIPAADSYQLLAHIYDIESSIARKRYTELAQMLKCEHVLNVQLRRLSLGERMKMEIIGALLHEPEVLFLDEPTIGLDVVAQSNIREFLAKYVKDKSPTIILTSHYMDDIAQLADQLLLISAGQIVYNGTVLDFMANSEHQQKLFFRFTTPLAEPVKLNEQVILQANQPAYEIVIPEKNLTQTITTLAKYGTLADLKFEEVDFEKVIHKFLEKESRRI